MKVESVNDTRSWDMNTLKPIPGTGDARQCDCCGSAHEVHVTLSDKRVVGVSCAKRIVGSDGRISSAALKRAAVMIALRREGERLASMVSDGLSNAQLYASVSGKPHHTVAAFFDALRGNGYKVSA